MTGINTQGHVGSTLVDTCSLNGFDFLEDDSSGGGYVVEKVHDEDWTEDLFGEGARELSLARHRWARLVREDASSVLGRKGRSRIFWIPRTSRLHLDLVRR